jgi:hypothetical protein
MRGCIVFFPQGFHVIFISFHLILNHGFYGLYDFMDFRGEWHSPFHDTDAFSYLRNKGVLPSFYRRICKLIQWMNDLFGAL